MFNSTMLNFTQQTDNTDSPTLSKSQIVIFTILFSLVGFIGLIGNSIVIIVISCRRELRHFTNYFFLNLSIADILVLIFSIPTVLQDIHWPDRWIYGNILCK
jgi:hypothetical protein